MEGWLRTLAKNQNATGLMTGLVIYEPQGGFTKNRPFFIISSEISADEVLFLSLRAVEWQSFTVLKSRRKPAKRARI